MTRNCGYPFSASSAVIRIRWAFAGNAWTPGDGTSGGEKTTARSGLAAPGPLPFPSPEEELAVHADDRGELLDVLVDGLEEAGAAFRSAAIAVGGGALQQGLGTLEHRQRLLGGRSRVLLGDGPRLLVGAVALEVVGHAAGLGRGRAVAR